VLEDTVRALVEAEGLDVDLDDAVWLCWSATQGLVVLEPKIVVINAAKGGTEDLSTAAIIRRFTRLIVGGLRGGAAPR
jgi:hypothetical protein